jgi:hypothetical protein
LEEESGFSICSAGKKQRETNQFSAGKDRAYGHAGDQVKEAKYGIVNVQILQVWLPFKYDRCGGNFNCIKVQFWQQTVQFSLLRVHRMQGCESPRKMRVRVFGNPRGELPDLGYLPRQIPKSPVSST